MEDLRADGKMILKWILKKLDRAWNGIWWLRKGNELTVSTKSEKVWTCGQIIRTFCKEVERDVLNWNLASQEDRK